LAVPLLDSLLFFFSRRYKIAVIFDFAALHIVVELLFPVNIGYGFLYGGQFLLLENPWLDQGFRKALAMSL